MPKYHIKGIYEMTYWAEIDRVVEADDIESAIEKTQDQTWPGNAYDQNCHWLGFGPVITKTDKD